jgi:hypothetical protein
MRPTVLPIAVEPDFVEAEFAHFFLHAFADRADLRIHRRDGAHLAQKLDDGNLCLNRGHIDAWHSIPLMFG